ncbi:MAG TPA: NAD(P)-dependent oxidoreductase [Caulobacteraceae bacterium]|nr:NAD(P)-dependent oxidoreductase [Caulobacteraceae bacterium]
MAERTVVITGGAGVLARKLRAHLAARDDFRLRLLDIAGGEGVIVADLSHWNEAWASTFDGADAVVHLVGLTRGAKDWPETTPAHLDAMLNVYAAAARYRVPRMVFASSVWTMAARRFEMGAIKADPLADPGTSPYGVAKLFGERAGKTFSAAFGVSTVALRIGGCREGENDFCPRAPLPDWNQACWLSNRDFCDGVVRAIEAEVAGFAVVNLVSANAGSRWTLDEANDAIGFTPRDGGIVRLRFADRLRAAVARFGGVSAPALARRLTPKTW